jgi:hypothetical protein
MEFLLKIDLRGASKRVPAKPPIAVQHRIGLTYFKKQKTLLVKKRMGERVKKIELLARNCSKNFWKSKPKKEKRMDRVFSNNSEFKTRRRGKT